MTMEFSVLYVVATPLGNLGDLTARAREVLCQVPWVAAEDTRHSALLLRHIGSAARLFAVHEHNEAAAADSVLARLAAGEAVALVTDAGTPAISDPGARLVARVRAAGAPVVPLPGPCAAIAALSVSGLAIDQWLFVGFLPSRAKARESELSRLAGLPCALVFYEAPHRILETATALVAGLGGARQVAVARELTKLFETVAVMPLAELEGWLAADTNRQRGEFVLIVEAAAVAADGEAAESLRVLHLLLEDGLSVRQATHLTQRLVGGAHKTLYDAALAWRATHDLP